MMRDLYPLDKLDEISKQVKHVEAVVKLEIKNSVFIALVSIADSCKILVKETINISFSM